MSDDLAHFRALPYETRRAIVDAIDVLQQRLTEARRELLRDVEKRGVVCAECRQPSSYLINEICVNCRTPVPCEVAGSEWEDGE